MHRVLSLTFYVISALFISRSDIRNRVIRNRDLLVFFLLGFILNFERYTFKGFIPLVFITLICLGLHLVFWGQIGAGDLKLFWVIWFWTFSFTNWLEGLTLAWVLGGLYAIAYFALNRVDKQKDKSIPFAPFIFLGFLSVI